jgi:hypothetical protein
MARLARQQEWDLDTGTKKRELNFEVDVATSKKIRKGAITDRKVKGVGSLFQ